MPLCFFHISETSRLISIIFGTHQECIVPNTSVNFIFISFAKLQNVLYRTHVSTVM